MSLTMMKEEQVLFPAIAALSRGGNAPVSLEDPIACMLHEHDDAGAALARLRELTRGFEPPAEACNTYRALFAGLRDLEEDLHRHIHLENAVLFPAALNRADEDTARQKKPDDGGTSSGKRIEKMFGALT